MQGEAGDLIAGVTFSDFFQQEKALGSIRVEGRGIATGNDLMAQGLKNLIGHGFPPEGMNLFGKLPGSSIRSPNFKDVVFWVSLSGGLKRVTQKAGASGKGFHQETRLAVPQLHDLRIADPPVGERDIVGVAADPLRGA